MVRWFSVFAGATGVHHCIQPESVALTKLAVLFKDVVEIFARGPWRWALRDSILKEAVKSYLCISQELKMS